MRTVKESVRGVGLFLVTVDGGVECSFSLDHVEDSSFYDWMIGMCFSSVLSPPAQG